MPWTVLDHPAVCGAVPNCRIEAFEPCWQLRTNPAIKRCRVHVDPAFPFNAAEVVAARLALESSRDAAVVLGGGRQLDLLSTAPPARDPGEEG